MRLIDYFDRGADLFPERLKKTLREPYWVSRERKI
jgi:hypothetical protein